MVNKISKVTLTHMNAFKEAIKGIKAIFSGEVPLAPAAPAATPIVTVQAAAKTYALSDGTEISVEQAGEILAVGDIVSIGGAPAPMGEHELADGTKITTDAAGVISAVTAPEPVTAEPAAAGAPQVTAPAAPAPQALSREDIEAIIDQRIAAAIAQSNVLKMASDKETAILKETVSKTLELVEQMANVPTADPVTISEAKKNKFNKSTAAEKRLDSITNAVSNLRKK